MEIEKEKEPINQFNEQKPNISTWENRVENQASSVSNMSKFYFFTS